MSVLVLIVMMMTIATITDDYNYFFTVIISITFSIVRIVIIIKVYTNIICWSKLSTKIISFYKRKVKKKTKQRRQETNVFVFLYFSAAKQRDKDDRHYEDYVVGLKSIPGLCMVRIFVEK